MQYVVTGRDGTDEGALARRMAVRDAHIALSDQMKAAGSQLFGVAILNELGEMCGSTMVVDFDSREELEKWLEVEPYITGDVWRFVEVEPCRVGPSFVDQS